MSNSIYTLFLFLLLVDSACSNHKQTKHPVSLTARKKITQFNDTTFFSGVAATMVAADSSVYILDYKTNKLYHLDHNLKLLGTVGRSGKGPGEFTGLNDMDFVNDSLYAYDGNEAKILVYDNKNNFVREIGVPDNSGIKIAVDRQSHIFLSTPDRNHPITELNAHGHIIRAFGKNTAGKNSFHFLRNLRTLFVYNNKLIVVPWSEPFIKTYNLNGQLLHKITINRPEIHNLISRVKKENGGGSESHIHIIKKGNGGSSIHPHVHMLSPLFSDATLYKHNLYLLVRAAWPQASLRKKFTLVLDYKLQNNGKLSHKRTFKLFRSNHQHRLVGSMLIAPGNHTPIVLDKALFVFKDPQIQ
jgi:hypothetical protein